MLQARNLLLVLQQRRISRLSAMVPTRLPQGEKEGFFFFCNLSVVLVPLKPRMGGEPPWGHRLVRMGRTEGGGG